MKSLLNNLVNGMLHNVEDETQLSKTKNARVKFKSQLKAGGADGTVYNNADGSGSTPSGADGTVYYG